MREIYKDLFEFSGFNIIDMAKNGEEAVQMYESFSKRPDITIMDQRMPLKCGLEAAKEILTIDKNAKIIFISADETIKESIYSIGAIDFIKKPFNFKNLIKAINKASTKPLNSSTIKTH